MSENLFPASEDKERSVMLRTQQLLAYLEEAWKRPYNPSPDALKRIAEFLTQLPDVYQTLGMTKIAEYFVSILGLHFLDLLATFQQRAEDEGISKEELTQTIQGVMPELFPEMMGISKHVLVRSLDDLITLANITMSLDTLSQVDTAEEAQSWIYDLPGLYMRQLTQEKLLTNIQVHLTATKNSTTIRFSGSASWESSLPDPVSIDVSSMTSETPTIA